MKQNISLTCAVLFFSLVQCVCADSEVISISTHARMEKSFSWDVSKGESDVLLKPLGISGIQRIKLWHFPPTDDVDFPPNFDDAIEARLWQAPWEDPTFWQKEPMSENEQKYSNAVPSRVFIGPSEWSCTRHSGSAVRDIVNCYTFMQGGILVATYESALTNVSDEEALRQRDDVVELLKGITVDK